MKCKINYKHFGKNYHKLFKILPHNPADPLSYISKKNENIFIQKLHTNVYSSIMRNCKKWKQPKVHQRMINVMYIHKIEHYSEVQRNELLIHS